MKGEITENRFSRLVSKGHMRQGYVPLRLYKFFCAGAVRLLRLLIKPRKNPLRCRQGSLQFA